PPTNDCVCGIAFPSTDGSTVNLPLVSGCPLSLRVTGKTIVNRLPLVATVGVTIGTAITGLTTTGLGGTGVRAWAGAAVNGDENDPSSGALSPARRRALPSHVEAQREKSKADPSPRSAFPNIQVSESPLLMKRIEGDWAINAYLLPFQRDIPQPHDPSASLHALSEYSAPS